MGALTTATGITRVCDYSQRPPLVTAGEGVSVGIMNGGAASTLALLLFGYDLKAPPPGQSFWLRYSVTAGAAATANTWSTYRETDATPLTWETTPPSGTYAIIGMDHWGATAMAARLILATYRYRPGTLARTSVTATWNDPLFMDGRLGILGYFTNWQMPALEVLCTGADTAFEGMIRVIRIGGPEMLPSSR